MENWIGEVNTVEETVVLSFADGERCDTFGFIVEFFFSLLASVFYTVISIGSIENVCWISCLI